MPTALRKTQMSVEEYLEFERTAEGRHAYYQGEVFAMAGASPSHCDLQWRLTELLGPQLRAQGCKGFNSEMRVKVEATGLYTYPDASVTCHKPRFDGRKPPSLLNPQAVFEVLSESTELYDRTRKFDQFAAIPTLRYYVLISQAEPRVEVMSRQDDGRWEIAKQFAGGEAVVLEGIGVRLDLTDLYAGIELSPGEELQTPREE